eukprot:19253-Heterococcus_DN1.PRE.3
MPISPASLHCADAIALVAYSIDQSTSPTTPLGRWRLSRLYLVRSSLCMVFAIVVCCGLQQQRLYYYYMFTVHLAWVLRLASMYVLCCTKSNGVSAVAPDVSEQLLRCMHQQYLASKVPYYVMCDAKLLASYASDEAAQMHAPAVRTWVRIYSGLHRVEACEYADDRCFCKHESA